MRFNILFGATLYFFSLLSIVVHGEPKTFQHVLHLKGSAYEMGYQHGKLLKKGIESNIKRFIDDQILANRELPKIQFFLAELPRILEHVPEDYKKEMRGIADGSNLPYDKIVLLNLFPEMFHCTGMTVSDRATQDGELYHVRVLDYGVGQNLQDTAVLLVVEPVGKIPFLNVSYAGFIGCVTGMNAQHIALGEIGGKGYGRYDGMPMTFLLRMILEQAANLESVKKILEQTKRTCEYYYVFSDGKTKRSFGVYATSDQLVYIEPGTSYALFDIDAMTPQTGKGEDIDEKFVLTGEMLGQSGYQTVLYQDDSKKQHWGLINKQPEHCLVITGFPNPQRYPVLIQRILDNFGKIGVKELQEMIKSPVSNPTNLHNAIFIPATLDAWVVHAGPKGEPAYGQPYAHFNLKTLLEKMDEVD